MKEYLRVAIKIEVGYTGSKKGDVFKFHRCAAQFVQNLLLIILVPIFLKSDENSEGAAIFSVLGMEGPTSVENGRRFILYLS